MVWITHHCGYFSHGGQRRNGWWTTWRGIEASTCSGQRGKSCSGQSSTGSWKSVPTQCAGNERPNKAIQLTPLHAGADRQANWTHEDVEETATVKIFLAQGDPGSLRTAEISNWTGKAVAGPRSRLDLVLHREEAAKPGVYFLTGVNPKTGKQRVYIGDAEVIRTRIKGHSDRDFWK